MTTRRLSLALVLTMVLSGCSVFGGGPIEISATFDDVRDLVTQAHVRAGDVPIGLVTGIDLTDNNEALVTMEIEDGTGLPHDVEAVLSKTSLLGERFIDLRPLGESGQIEDGQIIQSTRVITDFETLVLTGNDVLAFMSAEQLAAAVETGAVAFGGNGGLIGQFLESVNGFVGELEEDQDVLIELVDALDGLTGRLAPDAEGTAASLATLEEATQVLREEDDRLLDALDDLRRLTQVTTDIMSDHRAEIDGSVTRLRRVLDEVLRFDGALNNLLVWLPSHNRHVPRGAIRERAQVWLDFLFCGFNDDPADDPSRSCDPPNPDDSTDPSDYPADPTAGRDEQYANDPGYEPGGGS